MRGAQPTHLVLTRTATTELIATALPAAAQRQVQRARATALDDE
jgi:hypothetical protein